MARRAGNGSGNGNGRRTMGDRMADVGDKVRGSQAWTAIFRPGSIFRKGYTDFVPEPVAFRRDDHGSCTCQTAAKFAPSANGHAAPANDLEDLVRTITDQVMASLANSRA